MKYNTPKLSPPCKGWREDLCLPSEHMEPNPKILPLVANHIDTNYLEIPRSTINMRGLMLLTCPISAIFLITTAPSILLDSLEIKNFALFTLGLALAAIFLWQIALFARLDLHTPLDEPIRFNRARQKIYAYNFYYYWWNPFTRWPTKVVTYDWSQVRAERWKQQGFTPQGSHVVKIGIMLSIVTPGTDKVIDRFPLSCVSDNKAIWTYICTYMQSGPSAVPSPPPPPDHNDTLWYEYAKRLAPKVNWPTTIDHESRTAPRVHEGQTQNQSSPGQPVKQ